MTKKKSKDSIKMESITDIENFLNSEDYKDLIKDIKIPASFIPIDNFLEKGIPVGQIHLFYGRPGTGMSYFLQYSQEKNK